MKTWIFVLFLFGILFGGFYVYQNNIVGVRSILNYSICDTPIKYSIASLDPKFNLKEETLLKDIEKAGNLWNRAYGRDIFIYDPEGGLDIHFVYDKKQELSQTINQLEGTLNKGQKNLEQQNRTYENAVKIYKQKLDIFNSEVKHWNESGGGTQEEYERLKNTQEELQKETEVLNNLAQNLNITVNKYDSEVGRLNQAVGDFNTELGQRPEEGVYFSGIDKIEIYFVPSKNEMIHTLAHEFGHSLGVEHLNIDKKSIMYPFTSESIILSKEDKQALASICASKPIWSDYLNKVQQMLKVFANVKYFQS